MDVPTNLLCIFFYFLVKITLSGNYLTYIAQSLRAAIAKVPSLVHTNRIAGVSHPSTQGRE